MDLTQNDVDHLSSLAKVSLPPGLKASLMQDLSRTLQYVQRLEEIDTDGVEPMGHSILTEVLPPRGDSPKEGLSHEDALSEAPETLRGYFRVPKIL